MSGEGLPFGPVQLLVLGFDRTSFDGTIMPELEAQQAANVPAAAPATPQVDMVEQLEKLAQLKDQGVLTQEEFDAQKQKLLGAS